MTFDRTRGSLYTILVVIFLSNSCLAEYVRYDRAKTYSFDCPEEFRKIIENHPKFRATRNKVTLELWSYQRGTSDNAIAFVTPEAEAQFLSLLQHYQLKYRVLNQNVQKAYDKEKRRMKKRKFRLSSDAKGILSMDEYHTYEEIEQYFKDIDEVYSEKCKLFNISATYENRTVYGIKVSQNLTQDTVKPSVVVVSGLHAREWLGHATALYILNELVHNRQNKTIHWMLQHFDCYIIPVGNPDGYVHTINKNRLWRKTRSINLGGVGVDMNRNFGYHWGEEPESNLPYDEVYAGPEPFSEVETKGIVNFINNTIKNHAIYLDIHAFMQAFLMPWGYTKSKPEEYRYLKEVCANIVKRIKMSNGNTYSCGTPPDLLYITAGTSMDYYYSQGVPISMSVEVRPFSAEANMTESVFKASMAWPPDQIVPTGKEVLVSLHEMAKYYINHEEELGRNK
ncbi:unnamed protein product [Bursaphelenchus okinawaensis]|uniref:Peptidase M14 domain-containing protein n=1 Tax=Bursaphelenchus okinawaensis TaxID=465554 RepID=A0A811JVB7_9BILA|nr:unnamed protein product [Bursaphelenchus okinawaensis]CAG9085358.1 unnamed protein product [Bursaphelenchus okinawaensis]